MPEGSLIAARLFRVRPHQHRAELGIVADRLDQSASGSSLSGMRSGYKGRVDQRRIEIDHRLASGQLLFNLLGALSPLVELIERRAKGAHRLGISGRQFGQTHERAGVDAALRLVNSTGALPAPA